MTVFYKRYTMLLHNKCNYTRMDRATYYIRRLCWRNNAKNLIHIVVLQLIFNISGVYFFINISINIKEV